MIVTGENLNRLLWGGGNLSQRHSAHHKSHKRMTVELEGDRQTNNSLNRVKVKFTLEQATKALRGVEV